MNYIVEQILKQRKITDYLLKKGIFPVGPEKAGKLKYHCPIHANDNTPSFFVYLNSQPFENFYCYSCKAKYHIIHLYRDIEKVTISEAVKALASGIDIDLNAEINHIVKDIENDSSPWAVASPVHLSLQINKTMYNFLKEVDHDSTCVDSVENMSQVVDLAVEQGDLDKLQMINDTLPDVLLTRMKMYLTQKEERERIALNSTL